MVRVRSLQPIKSAGFEIFPSDIQTNSTEIDCGHWAERLNTSHRVTAVLYLDFEWEVMHKNKDLSFSLFMQFVPLML